MSPRPLSEEGRFWLKLGVAFFVVLLGMVWEHVEARRIDGRMKEMRREADRLVYENGRLRTQINQWTSTSNLDQVAREKYKMQPLESKHVIGLQKS